MTKKEIEQKDDCFFIMEKPSSAIKDLSLTLLMDKTKPTIPGWYFTKLEGAVAQAVHVHFSSGNMLNSKSLLVGITPEDVFSQLLDTCFNEENRYWTRMPVNLKNLK